MSETEASSSIDGRIDSIMDMDYSSIETPDRGEEVEVVEPDLNEDEEPTPKKVEKKVEKKEDDEEEVEVEEEEEEEDKPKEEEKNGRLLKYKVDGKEVEKFFTDEELNARVSAYDASLKKITEAGNKTKEIERREAKLKENVEFYKKELGGVKKDFEDIVGEFKQSMKNTKNPLTPIYNLLDKMGIDPSQYDKAVLYHQIPMVAKFLDLTDEGRELFLAKHENEWHKRRSAANEEEKMRVAQYQAKLSEENSKKRQAGLTDEDVQTYEDELRSLGIEEVTLDKVIEWKQIKPAYQRAQGIAKLVGKNDIINQVTDILLRFPNAQDDEVLNFLGFKDFKKKELDEKVSSKAKATPAVKKERADFDVDEVFAEMFKR